MTKKKADMQILHKRRLDDFLTELGILDAFNSGTLVCKLCERTITRENLGYIFPYQGEIVLCCDDAKCIYKMQEARE
jgi:hypothetical protein